MIKVPCIRPSMIAIAIAEMNMPVMIQTMSMLVPSHVPEVHTHLHQAQQGQCDQDRQQDVHHPVDHLNTHIATGIAMA